MLCRALANRERLSASGPQETSYGPSISSACDGFTWQPSDQDEDCLRSIAAWAAVDTRANLRPPLYLDVTDAKWPVAAADAVISINMLHIAPWSVAQALLRSSSCILEG